MEPRVMMASKFKEQCLALLDLVQTTRTRVVVTKRGRPVAQLVPVDDAEAGRPTMESVRLLAEDDQDYFSTGETWEAEGSTSAS